MAKRKAAKARGRKPAGARAGGGRSRSAAKKAARKAASKRAARRTARASTRTRPASRKRTAVAARRGGASARKVKGTARKAVAKKVAKKTAKKTASRRVSRVVKKAAPVPGKGARAASPAARRAASTAAKKAPQPAIVRKAPNLNRERRIVQDDDIVPSPPSSLDLDRTASAARSGRRELLERFEEHTETSPALTGGDVDADWESAYSVGDEAPGGDNPTPDQDIVDDIGRALGNEYQDNEELKGEAKISKRDRNRWELDPASSEDWDDRD